jgi:ubiquinone biosynthesis accessory factor UbiJ
MNVGEYLAHEKRVLVPRLEAEQYLQEVDALREQTDRLAARVASLEAARGAP